MDVTITHYETEPIKVAVFEKLPADFAQLLLTVRAEHKYLSERLKEIRRALDHIQQLSDSEGSFFVDPWPAHIATGTPSMMSARGRTFATLCLRKPLQGNSFDVFACAEFFEALLDKFPSWNKVGYEGEPIRLCVTDPESYRPRLLARIVDQINELRATFGTDTSVTVSGLQGPVLVWQVSPHEVAVAIDYKLRLTV